MPKPSINPALRRYSLGQASLSETVVSLGVTDGGVVLGMMREAKLPVPKLKEAVARQQATLGMERLRKALRKALAPSN